MRLMLLTLGLLVGLAAAAGTPLESEVKAAMVFNFTKFVEWSPNGARPPEAGIVLAVIGDDSFGALLDRVVRDKQVGGRPVVVKKLDSAKEAAGCHLAYLANAPKDLAATLRVLQDSGTLTVSDLPRFLEAGGMIALTTRENKVRFSINADAAGRAGVRISSRLLWLSDNGRGEAR